MSVVGEKRGGPVQYLERLLIHELRLQGYNRAAHNGSSEEKDNIIQLIDLDRDLHIIPSPFKNFNRSSIICLLLQSASIRVELSIPMEACPDLPNTAIPQTGAALLMTLKLHGLSGYSMTSPLIHR